MEDAAEAVPMPWWFLIHVAGVWRRGVVAGFSVGAFEMRAKGLLVDVWNTRRVGHLECIVVSIFWWMKRCLGAGRRPVVRPWVVAFRVAGRWRLAIRAKVEAGNDRSGAGVISLDVFRQGCLSSVEPDQQNIEEVLDWIRTLRQKLWRHPETEVSFRAIKSHLRRSTNVLKQFLTGHLYGRCAKKRFVSGVWRTGMTATWLDDPPCQYGSERDQ